MTARLGRTYTHCPQASSRRALRPGWQKVVLLAGESPRIRRRAHAASACRIVLVRPHYPENVGAVARAMRVTGFSDLVLVAPGPLAAPSHEQARKMAVGAGVLLDAARVVPDLAEAMDGTALVVGTSARSGLGGVLTPREASRRVVQACRAGVRPTLMFGGERTGLRKGELARCSCVVRIPMVANEPSLNLAQAAMVMLYEILVTALEAGSAGGPDSSA